MQQRENTKELVKKILIKKYKMADENSRDVLIYNFKGNRN